MPRKQIIPGEICHITQPDATACRDAVVVRQPPQDADPTRYRPESKEDTDAP